MLSRRKELGTDCLKPNELPEHAQVKIREFEKDPKGIRVKFSKTSRAEKQLKKYEKRSRS